MSLHSFDPAIAQRVGCAAATIYQNIFYWNEKNAANGEHFHDGRFWTYNSIHAFTVLFPYLTAKQIRTCLDKLESEGLIVCGNFNKSQYDRTKWFSVNCMCPDGQIHLPVWANGFASKGEPIPDINTNTKLPPNPLQDGGSPEKKLWDEAKAYLGTRASGQIGKWIKDHGLPAVQSALDIAKAENGGTGADNPIAFMAAVLRNGAERMAAQRRIEDEQRQSFDRRFPPRQLSEAEASAMMPPAEFERWKARRARA